MIDYFALFSLNKSIIVDLQDLEQKYIELQRAHHPDTGQHNIDLNMSASINTGYRVLKNELERIDYLLSEIGVDLNAYKDKIDQAFLHRVLEDMEAINEEVAQENLKLMLNSKKQEKAQIFADIAFYFEKNMIDDMILAFIKYKYINNILSAVKHRIK